MPRFPTTCWSLVRRASEESATGSREDMGQLLERYQQPMLVHLRYKGVPEQAAEDLVQEFMLEMLDQQLLSIADASKGKFRSLLLTALDRFAISRHRYESAAKRRPKELQSLDVAESDQTEAADTDPGAAFERAWALDVLAETLAATRRECDEQDQLDRWTVFDRRILRPLLEDDPPASYGDLADELGLVNEKAAMNLLVTAKRQFARTLRELVREYVTRSRDGRPGLGDASAFDSDAIEKSAARQFAEHTIQKSIEQEINELQKVLAAPRSAGAVPHPTGDASKIDDPLKREFWNRLAGTADAEPSSPDQSIGTMYGWGADLGDDDLPACFDDLLETDIRWLLGGDYGLSGPLRQFLFDGEPVLPVLEHLKEWASVQRLSRSSEVSGKLASAVYFLVIATALVRGGKSLTGLESQSLRAGLEWVDSQPWIGEDQRAVAAEAINTLAA